MPELDRRDFLKAVGLTAGAAATLACQEPVEKVIPYLVQPEEIIPGIPTYYASTCRECPTACGMQVKTREGRPIKVDGNPLDPISQGALCVRGQASLYRTYDSARHRGPLKRDGESWTPIGWEEGLALLVERLRPAAAAGKAVFLGGAQTGTLDGLIDQFLAAIGSPQRLRFELYAQEALRSANEIVFGTGRVPTFDLRASDVLVAFGTDFMETWLNPVQNQAGFANSRRDGAGFAIFVGPRLGMSGQNADIWLAPEPGTEIFVALGLAHEVAGGPGGDPGEAVRNLLAPFGAERTAELTGVPAAQLRDAAERMRTAQAPLALPPGSEIQGTNATAFAAAVQILNFVSGAVNRTVRFGPDANLEGLHRFRDLKELAGRMRGDEVEVLLVHETNPVYAGAGLGFAEAMGKVPFIVSFSSAPDETSALAHLILPDDTPYESWGDAEPVRGVRRLQQPTIRPIFDTRPLGDVLLETGRALGVGDALPTGSFRDQLFAAWGGPAIDAALASGGDFKPAAAEPVALGPSLTSLQFEPAQLGGDGALALVAYPSLHFYDGRSARLLRLQEVPDAVTKSTWGSVAEIHPDTAAALGVERGDVLRIRTEQGQLELPALPHEGVRPGVVAIQVGQGHQPIEPNLDPTEQWGQVDWLGRREVYGVNVLSVLSGRLDPASGGLAWYSSKVGVEKTGAHQFIAYTQATSDQEGRGIGQATTLAALRGEGEDLHEQPHMEVKPFDPAADSAGDSPYRWGMSIDLDACTGCNACVAACAQENNTPTIGKELVLKGREMSWIRLNRFVEHNGDAVEIRQIPMLCQHCGAAPCESVCPVFATYHSDEGLNVMVYNRCIGTRYCSNNCPYKVRRFNYLPYDFEIRAPENLALNPDVTVRTKGVMEKCSFCVQRIKYAQDLKAGTDDVVADGEVVSACQQACPSQAITFGNLKDPESRVRQLLEDPRQYYVFEHLYTRPAVSYLKSIRRVPTEGDHGDGGAHHG